MNDRLLLAGNPQSIHVGAHLEEGARGLGLPVCFCDSQEAFAAARGHRPTRLRAFSQKVVEACREFRPAWLLSTGLAPIEEHALATIGKLGVKRLNYLTDDPWNPVHRASWFLRALSHYDQVFSPRRSNMAALRQHGCPVVCYMPFAYAPSKHLAEGPGNGNPFAADVIFAGGADADRVPPIAALIAAGFRLALYGGYWNRYPETRPYHLGHACMPALRKAVAAAKIALCLVRRANRDGHVMRTFEIPAMGGCMLAEDTLEHREIFGAEGEAVLYFNSIPDMIGKTRWLIDHDDERQKLAARAHLLIVGGRNTYRDRLAAMLNLSLI